MKGRDVGSSGQRGREREREGVGGGRWGGGVVKGERQVAAVNEGERWGGGGGGGGVKGERHRLQRSTRMLVEASTVLTFPGPGLTETCQDNSWYCSWAWYLTGPRARQLNLINSVSIRC